VQSIASWGTNFGKNVSSFFEPATKIVSQEIAQIKEESSKKIEERKLRAQNNANNNTNNDIELNEISQEDLPDNL